MCCCYLCRGLRGAQLRLSCGDPVMSGHCTFGGVLERTVVDGAQNLRLQQEIAEACSTGRNMASGRLGGLGGSAIFLLRHWLASAMFPLKKPCEKSNPSARMTLQEPPTRGFCSHKSRRRQRSFTKASQWASPCRNRNHTGEGPRPPFLHALT